MTGPDPRQVLAALAEANPGVCECGHLSNVHGFGSGECWTCAFAAQWADEECRHFRAQAAS